MQEEEEDRGDYHLDPSGPEVMDEIIALERSDYIKLRPAAIVLIPILLVLLLFQIPAAQAGGPKCDRKDSEKCGMAKGCAGMTKDGKKSGSNCSNQCHRGCCFCPTGDDPTEGQACPRDQAQGNPEEEK